MSQRNTQEGKRERRVRRSLKVSNVDAFIDLVPWLKLRGYADTTGKALRLIFEEKVRANSHPLGRVVQVARRRGAPRLVLVDGRVPAEIARDIVVSR